MANASFCPTCGEIISDGCPELDEHGNETDRISYSPCQCVTGIDSNGRRVEPATHEPEPYTAVTFVASLTDQQREFLQSILEEVDAGREVGW